MIFYATHFISIFMATKSPGKFVRENRRAFESTKEVGV